MKNCTKDVLGFVTIFLIGGKFTYNIETTLTGIKSGDEPNYISAGINLLKNGLPSLEWAPFYSIWYYFLSLANNDSLSIFQLSYKIIFILLPVLFYIFLRRYKVSPFIALFMASFMMLSNVNAMHIKVTNFALIFIFAFLILGSFIKQASNYFLFMSFSSLLVSYIRPEFFLSSVLLLIISFLFYSPKIKQLIPPRQKFKKV